MEFQEKKEAYIKAQKDLRNQIEEDDTRFRNKMIHKFINEGGAKSQTYWKLRKKIIKKEGDANYETKDEQGNTIENPNEAKNHIADYYEKLYQAREGTEEYKSWTEKITEKIKELKEEMRRKPPVPDKHSKN